MPTENRLVVTKGFSRNCKPGLTDNVRVYCCDESLCNRSNILLSSSIFVINLIFLIIISIQ